MINVEAHAAHGRMAIMIIIKIVGKNGAQTIGVSLILQQCSLPRAGSFKRDYILHTACVVFLRGLKIVKNIHVFKSTFYDICL